MTPGTSARDLLRFGCLLLISSATAAAAATDLPAGEKGAETFQNARVPHMPDGAIEPGTVNAGGDVGVGNKLTSWMPDNLVLLPLPSREPVFGWGLDVLGGVFLDLDKKNEDTPASTVGAMGGYTENRTWYAGGAGRFHLLGDNLRIDAAAFYADVNYRFWGVGGDAGEDREAADVSQEIPMVYANAKYQVFPNGYLGLGYVYTRTETSISFDDPQGPPEGSAVAETLKIAAVELPFQYDTRDAQRYPRDGWLVDAKGMLYRRGVGGDINTESLTVSANRYITLRERDVLALRAMTTYTGKGAPFYLQASIGGRRDMRGYQFGRYIDRMSYSLQAEYRWQFADQWIATGFVGVAEVAPSYSEFFKNMLPAAGIGGRWLMNRKYNVTLALDVAWGQNGGHYYFTVGEAF